MQSERAHLRLAAFSSLVFIGPILNEIFSYSKTTKLNKTYIDVRYFRYFRYFLISMLSYLLCGSRVVYPIISRLLPNPPRIETRQLTYIFFSIHNCLTFFLGNVQPQQLSLIQSLPSDRFLFCFYLLLLQLLFTNVCRQRFLCFKISGVTNLSFLFRCGNL